MTYQDALNEKSTLEKYGYAVPAEVLRVINEHESRMKSGCPIYNTLKAHSKFPVTKEKEECVEGTVNDLLADVPNANDPGLLLGKIQCGKTDTFENIIGLAFDRGIDITVVLTKGTNALVDQTIKRMRHDYRFFKPSDDLGAPATILIEDIMDNRKGFNRAQIESSKLIIVAKKEAKNLDYLIKIFSIINPWLKDKKVLIVDDEADFASRNYKSIRDTEILKSGKQKITKAFNLAKISQLIDEFRLIPHYCRYLQVTATPYCLFLQPDGNIEIQNGKALSFKPRFTRLVPVHNRYIGGKQYFVESADPDSMYSHLFHAVSEKCIHVLGHVDKRYLKSGIGSDNIIGLTYALVGYLMATAIRRLQKRAEGKNYKSSAILHANIDKDDHDWQKTLIDFMMRQIREYFCSSQHDVRLDFLIDSILNDFKESSKKAMSRGLISSKMPAKSDILKEVKRLFTDGDINIKIVNSDNDVNSLLDRDNGQLRLDASANIFIGGSILDRGITINNMLCFFYGRDPKKFQQDTVLQHARFYGARDLEDMAVTRLYTTDEIYRILRRMNELDEQLRQWLIDNASSTESRVPCVGFDKNIKPCAMSKIKPAKVVTIGGQKRFLPVGMNTGSKTAISKTIREIDQLITSSPNYKKQDKDGFFEMDLGRAMDILKLIDSTYTYKEEDEQIHKGDMREVKSVLYYAATKSDNKVWVIHRTGRNMSRIRENGGWIDAPDDGRTDIAPARLKATNRPVLMLIKQKGEKRNETIGIRPNGTPIQKNLGWNGAEFYWPVVMTQASMPNTLFAANQKENAVKVTEPASGTYKLDPRQTLNLTFKGDLFGRFGEVGDEFSLDDNVFETRGIRDTTAGKYLWREADGSIAINEYVDIDPKKWAGVYTFNDGIFPFILKDYKYLVLRSGPTDNPSRMIFELYPKEEWLIESSQEFDNNGFLIDCSDPSCRLITVTDTVTSDTGKERDTSNEDLCQWIIDFRIKKILDYIPAEE